MTVEVVITAFEAYADKGERINTADSPDPNLADKGF